MRLRRRRGGEAQTPAPAVRHPGARGWLGPGRGEMGYVQAADEWRGTTVQVCGLWPFAPGVGLPMVGVPLGRHIYTGATLCADPISWFQANIISNPSAYLLGLPGLGKSSTLRRIATGLAGFGVLPLVLGDLKPDYVDLIEAMGGQVIRIGRGRGHLNILDPGEAVAAADRLTGKARAEVLADALGRRHTMVSTLVTIARAAAPIDREEIILDRALRILDERSTGIPVLPDLIQVIHDGPEELRLAAMDRGERVRYDDIVEALQVTLNGLLAHGRLGEIFSGETTVPMRRDVPVVFDVSSIDDSDLALQGAALMACWSYGFGAVNVAHALADAGKEPRRHYFVILDELWRALRAGQGMVDRVDALTRLNRTKGIGVAMCSHTMSDLMALPHPEDRMKARGFVERAGMVICGGLPAAEMAMLTQAVPLSHAEQELLISWQDPPAWDSVSGEEADPPGRGHFLVKLGGRPGIPIHITPHRLRAQPARHQQALARAQPHPPRRRARRGGRGGARGGAGVSAHRSKQAQRPGGRAELVLLWLAITVVVVAVGGVTAAVHLANGQLRHPARLPGNPFTLVGDLARGRLRWPAQATVYLVVIAAAALALLSDRRCDRGPGAPWPASRRPRRALDGRRRRACAADREGRRGDRRAAGRRRPGPADRPQR